MAAPADPVVVRHSARAVTRAPKDRSIPRPVACGSSCSRATRMQPDPVPKSTIRKGACRSGRRSRAVSTTVSVSGPGHQGLGGEAEGQAPELPLADDPGHRLMGQAAAGEGGEGLAPARRSGACHGCVMSSVAEMPSASRSSSRASRAAVSNPASLRVRRSSRRASARVSQRSCCRTSAARRLHAAWSCAASWAA